MKALKPRKIFFIVPEEGLLTEYINTNSEFSHVHILIVPSSPIIYRKMGVANGLRLLKKMIVFRRIVNRIIKEQKIDWAYINTLSCLFAVPPLKSCGLKVFLHVHEILENNKVFTKYINKFALRWCDKIIAVSEPVKLNLLEVSTKKQAEKMTTILNGISDIYCPAAAKSHLSKRITLMGRIKPEKGIWFFLDTISLLPEEFVNKSKFLIIGDAAPGGEHFLKKLEEDIQNHPAKNYIKYYPFIKDIRNIINESDVIVVPSLMKDPFPTTILEGLSAGKPVIATNTGGAVQSIKDEETGFLIEPLDKVKFADCLEQLIKSDALRMQMGEQARKEFLENFTLEIFETNFMQQVSEFETIVNNSGNN
ncbi:MAG TPA: glycosyltransferase family 4 protein [Parafilimonas sp.]|nr:glycosyltransferase family 4 protein [Parafilimonas sp.]